MDNNGREKDEVAQYQPLENIAVGNFARGSFHAFEVQRAPMVHYVRPSQSVFTEDGENGVRPIGRSGRGKRYFPAEAEKIKLKMNRHCSKRRIHVLITGSLCGFHTSPALQKANQSPLALPAP
jgi:hypothetical protein